MKKLLAIISSLIILALLSGCVDSNGYPLDANGGSPGKPLQVEIVGGTGSNGTSDHALLSHLDYASSNHTGFASSSDLSTHNNTSSNIHGVTGSVVGTSDTQELDNKTLDSSIGKGTWTASGTWTLPTITLGGNITFASNVGIQLVSTLSADGTYCGIVEAGTAGAALAFGDLVYLAVADSRWELADADAEATTKPKLGIVVQAAAGDGSATTILLWGKVRADTAFPALTVSAPVFVDTAIGDITNTAPSGSGDCVRIIGYGNTADELFFTPENDWIEIA